MYERAWKGSTVEHIQLHQRDMGVKMTPALQCYFNKTKENSYEENLGQSL